jgi:hypothetical protein
MDHAYLETVKQTFLAKSIDLEEGLSEAELARVEEAFGFTFPPDLRAVLQYMLPVSEGFPNWRNEKVQDLIEWFDAPAEGIAYDVEENGFWLPAWGDRPDDVDDAIEDSRRYVGDAPILIPVFSHRFIPAKPAEAGNPVFSVVESDVIVYGNDLAGYFHAEFDVPLPDSSAQVPKRIEFWSDLVEMAI